MKPIIIVDSLEKRFKKLLKKSFLKDLFTPTFLVVNAVDNISFEILEGESVAFLGPNGAGKTTTIKMLSGLIYPSSGKITIMGYTPFKRDPEFLRQIGLVMGNKAGLNWDLTPRQSFRLLKEIYQISDLDFNKRLHELTGILEIEKFLDTQVRRLSLGERMKMELIGSLLHQPKILFLDEPTVGLDVIAKQKIREFLRFIQKKLKVTILLTSHDMDDVEKVCDRVIVINKGQKITDNNLSHLISQYSNTKYVRLVIKDLAVNKEINYPDTKFLKSQNLYKIKKKALPGFLSYITAAFDVDDIDIIAAPLEEIIKDIFTTSR